MNTTAKGICIFLAAFSLLSVYLGYKGIDRLEQTHTHPFETRPGLRTVILGMKAPPDWLLLDLDSPFVRVGVRVLAVTVPFLWLALSFKYDRKVLGFVVLLVWTILCGWIGFWIYLHGALQAVGF